MLKQIPIAGKLCAAYIIVFLLILIISPYTSILITVTLALVLGCSVIWLIVQRYLQRPINSLIIGMNKLAEKEFDFRLAEDDQDEFGPLASSFNDMADMLTSSLTELKKNQDYLRSILESSADIIITVNPTGKIQTMNTGAENALGYRRLEMIGESIELVLADPGDRKIAAEKLRFSENVVNYETQFLTKSKQVRDALLTLSRLRNPGGEVIGTIVMGKDITEEKRLQKKLIQSQRFAAIGQVFTGIQHSMKNMLNACKGGAYMVRTGLAKNNQKMLTEGWAMVEEGIAKLTDMSVDMLQYVKEYKPHLHSVDIRQMLTEIDKVIRQTAKDKGIAFETKVSADLPTVSCDPRMIHSAIMDIVSNALDACLWKDYKSEETPTVKVETCIIPDRREVVILVTDNGCGMTNEVRAHIFTPFFSTKSKAGTGLGLSIAARMIGVHNGRIEVESEADHGTVFRIVLPIDGSETNKEIADGQESSGN